MLIRLITQEKKDLLDQLEKNHNETFGNMKRNFEEICLKLKEEEKQRKISQNEVTVLQIQLTQIIQDKNKMEKEV